MPLTHCIFFRELAVRVDASQFPGLTKSLWIGLSLTPISAFLCCLSPPTHANPGDINFRYPFSAFHPSLHFSPFTFQLLPLASRFLHPTSHSSFPFLLSHLPPHHPLVFLSSILAFAFHISSIFYHPYTVTYAFTEEGCCGSRHP
jgi:hypothetical protein